MDERMQVLEMLRDGKVTSEQASELLDALGSRERKGASGAGTGRTAQREAGTERRALKNDIHKLVEARMHGVTPEFVQEMKELGYTDLTLEELQDFKMFGVSPDVVRGLEEAGYSHLDHKELCELAMHGVTPEFIQQMQEIGIVDLGVNELTELHAHGPQAEVEAVAVEER